MAVFYRRSVAKPLCSNRADESLPGKRQDAKQPNLYSFRLNAFAVFCMVYMTEVAGIETDNLIIMELGRFFVRTNLGNRAEGSQKTRSECRSAIRRVSSAGFSLRKLAK